MINRYLVLHFVLESAIFNVVNVVNYTIADIVSAMEPVIGKRAVYDVVGWDSEYLIDTSAMLLVQKRQELDFAMTISEKR